jgi:hypothetical protein
VKADPLPISPEAPLPQQRIEKSARVAQVCCAPAETEVAVEIPLTVTGPMAFEVDPLPSFPKEPSPQQRIVLSASVAQE